jgi:hypothetical protein
MLGRKQEGLGKGEALVLRKRKGRLKQLNGSGTHASLPAVRLQHCTALPWSHPDRQAPGLLELKRAWLSIGPLAKPAYSSPKQRTLPQGLFGK